VRGAPIPQVNTSHLCLLNILYTLLRRLTIKQGITTTSGLRYTPGQVSEMFNSIKTKSATPINDSILKVFSKVLKKLLETGIPITGEFDVFSEAELPEFAAIYSVMDHLLETAPFFKNENKAVASAFLNQFFTQEYDFTTIYLQSNGKIKRKPEGADLGLVNLGSLFLLVLTATQEILTKNTVAIEAAGCAIPTVDFTPGPPPGPAPSPVVPARLSEEDRCKPGLVGNTTFKRKQMPSLNDFNKDLANNEPYLKNLYTYLEQVRNSDPPVGPLCKRGVNSGASEEYIHQQLMYKFGKKPVWHVALAPYKHDSARVDPASIEPIAGVPTRYGGTRKRKAVNKQKTKKIHKT
jgi:hypothetical protein